MYQLHHGDCLEVMATMDDNSVDAIVTDPPYGLSQHKQTDIVKALTCWLNGEEYTHNKKGFMGRDWDSFVPSPEVWKEVYRVLKPGGHALVFAGTRSQDLMSISLRLAGFEIRDTIMYCYGSGFPKSHDVSKAIDKAARAEREVVGESPYNARRPNPPLSERYAQAGHKAYITAPATPEAQQWQGWGTALKPAWEPVIVARKPLEGAVADNVLKYGTGAINIDGCRVETEDGLGRTRKDVNNLFSGLKSQDGSNPPQKRWPANVITDGSEEVVALFPVTSTHSTGQHDLSEYGERGNIFRGNHKGKYNGDSGSAARFFYCAKASKADRDEGCEGLEERVAGVGDVDESSGRDSTKPGNQYGEGSRRRVEAGLPPTMPRRNHHPCVKPTDLMRYLCRLVTPPGGIVLDPFMGSGSTGKAAMLEGFQFIGIERESEYVTIAEARIKAASRTSSNQLPLFQVQEDKAL